MSIDLRQAARDAAAKIANKPSSLVKAEIDQIIRILKPEAAKNATGVAASVLRRIEARLQKSMVTIKQLEARQNDSKAMQQLRETIDELLFNVALDWISLQLQITKPTSGFQDKLPKWFRNLLELAKNRGGVPIAGGGLRPFNLENTTGTRRDPLYKGEVIPHHALPEQQRKGLRPDGLQWLYNF